MEEATKISQDLSRLESQAQPCGTLKVRGRISPQYLASMALGGWAEFFNRARDLRIVHSPDIGWDILGYLDL